MAALHSSRISTDALRGASSSTISFEVLARGACLVDGIELDDESCRRAVARFAACSRAAAVEVSAATGVFGLPEMIENGLKLQLELRCWVAGRAVRCCSVAPVEEGDDTLTSSFDKPLTVLTTSCSSSLPSFHAPMSSSSPAIASIRWRTA